MPIPTKFRPMIRALTLGKGTHNRPSNGLTAACVMEAEAYIHGEWTDRMECVCPTIGAFLRSWNDGLNGEDRQILKQFIGKLAGSNLGPAVAEKRSWMALDWFCRVSTPAWLRLAGLESEAKAVESTGPIVDRTSARAAQTALDLARKAATAAWDAARDAARDAAGRAAAWDAAEAKLRPTVEMLHASALQLVKRMLAVKA